MRMASWTKYKTENAWGIWSCAHGYRDVRTVIYGYFRLVCPPIFKHFQRDTDGLVPHEFVVSLYPHQYGRLMDDFSVRTSENGGAQIFLCFFHSSPSVTKILLPKKVRMVYCSTGLGNRARWSVTSYKQPLNQPYGFAERGIQAPTFIVMGSAMK